MEGRKVSEVVVFRKSEWEGFLKDNELLIERYEQLIQKVKELESQNNELKDKLGVTEEELRSTQDRLHAIETSHGEELSKSEETLRRLRSTISEVLREEGK